MACPFFLPVKRIENPAWPHPARLPLGDGWMGQCTAPGGDGSHACADEVLDGCNLGYARNCPRLPEVRPCDAVRFSVLRDRDGKLAVQFVCEAAHAPGEHGMLEFEAASGRWPSAHRDARIQRMAECFVESYLRRNGGDRKAEDGPQDRAIQGQESQAD